MNTTTNAKARNAERHVGIDVGKAMLDIAIYEVDLYLQERSGPEGIRLLINKLKLYKLTRILVEATGGYERALVETRVVAEIPVIVVQPMHIRQFAKAQGILAKTDKIDARLTAEFGVIMQPEVKLICRKKVRHIKDLLARKRQLNMTRTQELNRSHKAVTTMKATRNHLIKVFEKEIEWVNIKLTKAVSHRMAKALRNPQLCHWRGRRCLLYADGRTARARATLESPSRCAMWLGAVQSRQRDHARQTAHSRRPNSDQDRSLHGDDVSHSTQPGSGFITLWSTPVNIKGWH